MSAASRLRSLWRGLRGRRAVERDMEEELRFHIEAYAADLCKQGLGEAEARRQAHLAFGSIEARKEQLRSSRGLRLWDELRADVRYALRGFRHSPGFTSVALISLALGIGANTTIFTLANSVLLDKLAVHYPDELRVLKWHGDDRVVSHAQWGSWNTNSTDGTISNVFTYPVYRQLRLECRDAARIFAFKALDGNRRLTASIGGSAETATAELVSGNYFPVLGLTAQLGRLISEHDDNIPGNGAVVVLSDHYWSSRFGRSPAVLGQTITLNHVPVIIVGVAPPGFTGVRSVQIASDLFLPFSMQPSVSPIEGGSLLADKQLWWVEMMARRQPGVTDQRLQAELNLRLHQAVRNSMVAPADATLPDARLSRGSRGPNFLEAEQGDSVRILLGIVGFVLVLACINIASLLLARSTARRREISVRMALGAARRRIVRQLLTESLLLSLAGGAAGLLMGYWSRNFIPHFLTDAWDPNQVNAHFNWRVFLFTGLISVGAGIAFGFAPAWMAAREDIGAGAKDRGLRMRNGRKNRVGQSLIVAQLALSLLLLTVAGLFLRTVVNLSQTDVGFDVANLLLFEIQPPPGRYDGGKSERLLHQIEERVAGAPGVQHVGMSMESLLSGGMSNNRFYFPGEAVSEKSGRNAYWNAVNTDFFRALKMGLLAGRTFQQSDAERKQPVLILNRAAALKFFKNANPVGQQLVAQIRTAAEGCTIIGVVSDAKYDDIRNSPPPTIYGFYRQWMEPMSMTFEVRTKMSPATMTPLMRKAVQSVDKDLPLIDVRTQREQMDAMTVEQRLFAALATAFGVLALAIASVGVFGLMAFSVASRRNEIGIRMALGAQAGQVLQMVLWETGWLAIGGIIIGIAAALLSTRVLQSMLYGLRPNDPATLILSVAILVATSLAAGWIPARRGAKIDPLEALRHE